MADPLKKGDVAKTLLLLSLAAGGLIASRYLGTRKVSAAERLAESLLDTERLRDAARKLSDSKEAGLAACAAYLVNFAYRAAEGIGAASGVEDPIGYSRTHTHPFTNVTATVLTEERPASGSTHLEGAPEPRQIFLTYAVTIPEVGEVRGTRQMGGLQMGLPPSRSVPDTLQITLPDGYTAQLESQFQVAESLVTGQPRLFGSATMRDNHGNVGRLIIAHDGVISGTITRDARVIGRFEGRAAHGLYFQQLHLAAGPGQD
jgi:hypothetical protein